MLIFVPRWCVGTLVHSFTGSFEFLPFVIPIFFQMEEEPFNPDYVEVDRVLEVSYCEDKDTGEVKYIFFHLLIISHQDLCIFDFPHVCLNHFCLHFFHFVGAVTLFSAYFVCLNCLRSS